MPDASTQCQRMFFWYCAFLFYLNQARVSGIRINSLCLLRRLIVIATCQSDTTSYARYRPKPVYAKYKKIERYRKGCLK